MKNLSIFLCALLWFTALSAQNHPANGISYQAMLSQSEKITYGTKLQNIPVANKDIKARFELSQSGAIVLTDEHRLTTDVNGIFSCVIGTGNTTPFGALLTDINWGLDSVMVRVFIDAGEGENLFSEQKLWSTAYAMYAPTAGRALNDKDTSATNELQYLNLVGDSVKLTSVSGGISLKPWTDGIAKNALDIATEKTRAEAAELALQNQIGGINITLANKTNELNAAKDTLTKFRKELNILSSGVSQNSSDIATNKTDISQNTADIIDLSDSISVHRSELNKNRGDINKNASDIATNKSDIAQNKTDIGQNTADIKDHSDSISVHRAELNKNRGDINSNTTNITTNKSDIAQNKTDIGTNSTDIGKNKTDIANNGKAIKVNSDTLVVHRTELNKNRGDINKNMAAIAQNKTDLAQHVNNDKDTDNTNELSDLSFNSSTSALSLSNPSTTGNKVDLSTLKDNLGNHTAQDTLNLNGNVLTDNTGDTLLIAIKGNDRDIAIESEDEVFIRTINNPNNATNGDIQLESSDEIILDAQSDIDIISGDDVTIKANGDDITLESSDDIKLYSGDGVIITSGNKDNITIDSDNDIELITTDEDFVEIWKKNSSGTPEFMYTLPNDRGSVGQFLQRSNDGGSEFFSDWSTYKLPTSDGSNGQTLVTDGSGNVSWGTSGDNLGNHKATQNIQLNGKYLSNDGGNEGVSINNSGQVGIGNNTPHNSAILDIASTTKGVLMPRMTEAQRNQITKPANGSIIFNTDNNKLEIFTDSVNGDFYQQGSRAQYDGPYHLQSFRPKESGLLLELNCEAGIRFTFSGYLECSLYSGDPGSGLTLIGQADNKKLLRNPTGITFQKENVKFTFSALNARLTTGNSYTFVFVVKDSTTGAARQSWLYVNTRSTTQNPNGEYWRGSNLTSLTQPADYDMGGSIILQFAPGMWSALNESAPTFTEVDGSTTNELQDLSYNPTTKKLTLSTPKTTGNEVDLSSLGGASKLDDLSDAITSGTGLVSTLIVGHQNLSNTGTIRRNTGFGLTALQSLTSGQDNTAIGSNVATNLTSGERNVAIGSNVMSGNTTGTRNIAIGYNTMNKSNQVIHNSIAIGAFVLQNVSGWNNVSVGDASMNKATTASSNAVVGGQAAAEITSGSQNAVLGQYALWKNTSGSYNTAVGANSIRENTINFNSALGYGAGQFSKSNQNTFLGASTGGNSSTATTGANNTYIGYQASPSSTSASNEIILGNSSVTELYTAADMNAPAFTTTSDRRLKKNIQPLETALDKVIRLNPVIYDKKRHMTSDEYEIHEIGFIAQELQQEFPEVVSQQPDENHTLGVNYQALIPVLTKATQEQQIIIEKQQQTIQNQNETIEALIRRIEALEAK